MIDAARTVIDSDVPTAYRIDGSFRAPLFAPGIRNDEHADRTSLRTVVDKADEWRCRLVISNEETIADSGEGYSSKQEAKRGIQSGKRAVPVADVHDTTDAADGSLTCQLPVLTCFRRSPGRTFVFPIVTGYRGHTPHGFGIRYPVN